MIKQSGNDGEGNNIAETYLTLQKWLDIEYPAGGNRPYIQFSGDIPPAEKYPNTSWAIDTSMQDRTIIGSGGEYTLGATGGEATHTLTVAESAQHSHQIEETYGQLLKLQSAYGSPNTNKIASVAVNTGYNAIPSGGIDIVSKSGDNQPHNNMQPYTVVNFWKRIA